MVAVNIARRAGDGAEKDTARNIRRSGEFVVNVASVPDLEALHASAAEYPPEVSEAEVLGLPLRPSVHVTPPRVASSPVQMECRLDQVVVLGRGINHLFIGEVVGFHLREDVWDGQRVNGEALRPLARPSTRCPVRRCTAPCCNARRAARVGAGCRSPPTASLAAPDPPPQYWNSP
jgi:flavin reductase (DIM6/NTAB) family NADH-FMN oxidoreductase RutF